MARVQISPREGIWKPRVLAPKFTQLAVHTTHSFQPLSVALQKEPNLQDSSPPAAPKSLHEYSCLLRASSSYTDPVDESTSRRIRQRPGPLRARAIIQMSAPGLL
jgi:hypothetical protein